MKLLNAFSVNMLVAEARTTTVEFERLTAAEARQALSGGFVSAVGHEDTARIFGQILGLPVEANRTTIALAAGERAVLGQYIGPRLPEGATELPPGARIDWFRVTVLAGPRSLAVVAKGRRRRWARVN
jgi:hypothetical protein